MRVWKDVVLVVDEQKFGDRGCTEIREIREIWEIRDISINPHIPPISHISPISFISFTFQFYHILKT